MGRSRRHIRERRKRRAFGMAPGLVLGLLALGLGGGWYVAEQVRADIRHTMASGRIASGFSLPAGPRPVRTDALPCAGGCLEDDLGASYAAMLRLDDMEACSGAPRELQRGCRDYVRGAAPSREASLAF